MSYKNKNLEKKKKDGSFYIYGKNSIKQIMEDDIKNIKRIYVVENSHSNKDILDIVKKAGDNKIPVEYINEKTAISKVGKVNFQGLVAIISKYQYGDQMEWEINIRKSKKSEVVLILDGIEDVGNFGAIIRTAAAIGISAIFVPSDRQAPVNGTVFKTSAGNILKVNILKVSNINQIITKLKKLNFWTYAVDMPENSKSGDLWTQDFSSNTAFVMGAEGKGVSEKVRENCDIVMPIPMENNVESLNVSVSTALALYEWKRQQK